MRWPLHRETFFRCLATLAILILGGLAWYGLHRDIAENRHPCVVAPAGAGCEAYACNIGRILGVTATPKCHQVLGRPR